MRQDQDQECKAEGCTSPVKAKGMCSKHHQRWYRTGSIELSQREYHNYPNKVLNRPLYPKCAVSECLRRRTADSGEYYCKYHADRFTIKSPQ